MASASSSAPSASGGYVGSSNSKAANHAADRAHRRPTFEGVERDDPAAEERESSASGAATAEPSISRQAGGASAVNSAGAAGGAEQGRSIIPSGSSTGAPSAGPSTGGAPVPMNNYAFFVKYTYSNECALLAYNFHEMVTQLGLFEYFTYRHDHRLISVTLAYIFYRYQVHHCDMALDLAVTLVYLEDVKATFQAELHEHNKDAFNLICYLAFLAHAFNADRTIRLSDWYKEIGWRSFRNCQQLNGYVFFLFSQVRRFKLRVSETRVKRYIRKLCSVPSQIHNES